MLSKTNNVSQTKTMNILFSIESLILPVYNHNVYELLV